jgi:hypothetical protein
MEDTSNIFPGLDTDTLNTLKASEKNWNTSFKNSGTKTLASGKNALASATSALGKNIDFAAKAPQFITYVANYVTTSVMSYLTESITDMLSINPGNIMSYATQMMPNFIVQPGQIMQELLKAKESIDEEMGQKMLQDGISRLNKEINTQVSKITGSINEKLSYVTSKISSIAQHAEMGPAWVKEKTDVETKKILDTCFNEIGKVRDTTKRNIQDTINNYGVGLGQQLADKINKKVKEQSKEQLDKINIQKQKALNKAKTAITNAKLKLMALIGG